VSQYIVITPEGNRFGPTDFQTLTGWAQDGRVGPGMMVEDVLSGQTMIASAVPGLFDEQGRAFAPYTRVQTIPRENNARASLICGLIGLVAWCFPIVGLPLGLSAIILGSRSLKSESRTLALIGIVLGIFTLLLSIANMVLAGMFLNWANSIK
jgi:hypothetical protein